MTSKPNKLPAAFTLATAFATGLATGIVAMPATAIAQEEAAEAVVEENPIDPDAMAAMDAMSAYLQTLISFTVTSDATTEVVLESGQKIQFGGTVDLKVHRPNAFMVKSEADTRTREMYYDGKSFTIFAPRLAYYASFDAPPSIGQTLESARTNYGIEVPLADLFTWGTDQTIRARVQEAMMIRTETIEGKECMHYAFRQQMVDWQLWVEEGEKPLPCKIVITSKDDPAMPQYTAVLDWDLATPVPASSLAFNPPADAHQITIEEISQAVEGTQ